MTGGRAAFSLLAALIATGCSSDRGAVLDVYAASSLTDAFAAIEIAFEADHPTIDVRLNLAGSSTLQRQILDGADADVFAPADVALLAPFLDPGDAEIYAHNTLTLVVPADDEQRRVDQPADLARADVLTARCAAGVPCGEAAIAYLAAAGIEPGRVTEEPNVRAVLTKVARGEADAGLVYVTDAALNGDVAEIPLGQAPTVSYAVAVLSENPAAATFAAFVHSPAGAEVLRDQGFTVP
ncbi:MAG: molybdate ABC transporter substrate-binding protein [Actinomycetota bacterium]